MTQIAKEDLSEALARFGWSDFRPGQEEVVRAVLEGRDALCVMPTGGGKSLCYQLPSIVRHDLTLVISPLIALMKDQVDSLERIGVSATCLNSSLDQEEVSERTRRLIAGEYDLVYVAPERLKSLSFVRTLKSARVGLLAVDEAHCISEWGHDFRPDYARIGRFRERLGYPQTIALTATATPDVREDIARVLGLRDPATFVTGFARPNLRFESETLHQGAEKDERLIDYLETHEGSGIVYAGTRKRCEEVAALIGARTSKSVGVYHAGLDAERRRQVQDDFMAGRIDLIAATNAFGMGIDKRDLRYVIHYAIPGTLEAYYQEAGRAGRDGLPSRCMLFYSPADRRMQSFFIDNAFPSKTIVQETYEFLRSRSEQPVEITQQELKDALNLPLGLDGIRACEQMLEKSGAIERIHAHQNLATVRVDTEQVGLDLLVPKNAKNRRLVAHAIESIVGEFRFERVYFRIEDLERKTSLPRASVVTALRELSKSEWFDYAPPFRGRAIRVVAPEKPFSALDLDFSELDARKTEEYRRLDCVVQYALSQRCRQSEILSYFGEANAAPCGTCDRCRPEDGGSSSRAPRALSVASTSVAAGDFARKLLSGVARGKERFGKQVIAQMLCGSESSKMSQLRLDALSTFGLLADWPLKDVAAALDSLITANLIESFERTRFRPLVKLTVHGEAAMKGGDLPPIPWPSAVASRLDRMERRSAKKPAAPAAAIKPAVASPASIEPPRNGSTSRNAAGDLFADATAKAPVELDDPNLAFASAVDPDYDDEPAFDDLPRTRTDAAHATPVAPAAAPKPAPVAKAPDADDPFWTRMLSDRGFTIEECARIRRLPVAVVRSHLNLAPDEIF
jgi:ATP-dependent DNA helicase RecQ